MRACADLLGALVGTLRVAARRSPGRTGLALAVLVAGAAIALTVVPDAGDGGGGPDGGATPPAGASSANGDEPTGDPPSRPGPPALNTDLAVAAGAGDDAGRRGAGPAAGEARAAAPEDDMVGAGTSGGLASADTAPPASGPPGSTAADPRGTTSVPPTTASPTTATPTTAPPGDVVDDPGLLDKLLVLVVAGG